MKVVDSSTVQNETLGTLAIWPTKEILVMFDTLKYSRVLEAAGVSRDQAEAHSRMI